MRRAEDLKQIFEYEIRGTVHLIFLPGYCIAFTWFALGIIHVFITVVVPRLESIFESHPNFGLQKSDQSKYIILAKIYNTALLSNAK